MCPHIERIDYGKSSSTTVFSHFQMISIVLKYIWKVNREKDILAHLSTTVESFSRFVFDISISRICCYYMNIEAHYLKYDSRHLSLSRVRAHTHTYTYICIHVYMRARSGAGQLLSVCRFLFFFFLHCSEQERARERERERKEIRWWCLFYGIVHIYPERERERRRRKLKNQ